MKRRLRTGNNVQPQTFPVVQANNNNNNKNEVVMIHLVPFPQAGQQQQQQQLQQQQVPQLTQTADFLQNNTTTPLATTATALEYSAVLCLSLAAWLVYLLLPKGVRKAYCRAYRRRYPRQVSSSTRRVAAAWAGSSADPRNNVSLNNSSSYYADSSQITPSSEYYSNSSEYNTASYNPLEEDQIILFDDETTTTTTAGDKGSFASVENNSVLQGPVQQQQRNRQRNPVGSIQSRDDDDDDEKDSYAQQKQQQQQQQQQPFPTSPQRRSIFAATSATTTTTTITPNNNNRFGRSAKTSGDVAERFASFFPNNNNNSSLVMGRTPSLSHPAIMHLPDTSILQETMRRLTDRGVRLMAHGVTCTPKRVWIRLDLQDPTARNLEWQTEVPRSIPNQSGATSIVLMRGAKHIIPLPNILYVDVGKKTSALQKADNKHIPATACFSLLTQTGSLDLQTNSKLERDAVVSCMSIVLDYVHPEHDWRMLYEQTPPASIATTGASSLSGGGGGGATALSNISSNAFPQATSIDI